MSTSMTRVLTALTRIIVPERRCALLHKGHAVTCLRSTTIVTTLQYDAPALRVSISPIK